jgi:hypothetical protein
MGSSVPSHCLPHLLLPWIGNRCPHEYSILGLSLIDSVLSRMKDFSPSVSTIGVDAGD